MTAKPTQAEIDSFCRAARDNDMRGVTGALAKFGRDIIDKPDSSHDTALTWAVWCGHYDIAALLLKNGADINAPERSGRTPVHCAVQTDKVKLLELLLKHNPPPDLNARDSDGRTPMMMAENFRRQAMIDTLKKHQEEISRRRREEQNRKLEELHQAKVDKLIRSKPRHPTPFKPKPPRP